MRVKKVQPLLSLFVLVFLSMICWSGEGARNQCALNYASSLTVELVTNGYTDAEGVAVGLINNDGTLDVAMSSYNDNKVAWFANNGAGVFALGQEFDVTAGPSSLLLADFDNLNGLDLAVTLRAKSPSAGVVVYMNNGAGSLNPAVTVASGVRADSISAVDMNGDGLLDLLFSSSHESVIGHAIKSSGVGWMPPVVSAYLGDQVQSSAPVNVGSPLLAVAFITFDGLRIVSSASLTAPFDDFVADLVISPRCEAGLYEDALAVGDLNGDTVSDFVVGCFESIVVFMSTGPMVWSEHAVVQTVDDVVEVVLRDVNNDGHVDIVAALDSGVGIAFNDGANYFPGALQYLGTTQALAVDVGDMDGDGTVDVVFGSRDTTEVAWLHETRTIAFGSPLVLADTDVATIDSIVSGDLDGDGYLDLVIGGVPSLTWLRGQSNGALIDRRRIAVSNGYYRHVQLADMDQDGSLDVVCSLGNGNGIQVFVNDGSGSFTAGSVVDVTSNVVSFSFVADVDGDGDTDVIAARSVSPLATPGIRWYENDGTGVLNATARLISSSSSACMFGGIFMPDLDGDGVAEIYMCITDNEVLDIGTNAGDGSFMFTSTIPNAERIDGLVAGDLDGDGVVDLVVLQGLSDGIYWYRHLGSLSFGTKQTIVTLGSTAGPSYAHLLDLNGDSVLDVAWSSRNVDFVGVVLGTGGGAFGVHFELAGFDAPSSSTWADFSKDGFPDLVISHTGTVSLVAQTPLYTWAAPTVHIRRPPGSARAGASSLRDSLASVSPCWVMEIEVPPAVAGCSLTGHIPVRGSEVTLMGAPGGSVIDCGARGGVLFSADSLEKFVVDGVSLRRASVGSSLSATSALHAASGVRMELRGVHAEECDTRGFDASQSYGGRGGVILLDSGASLLASNCTFVRNAAVDGGVVALVGVGVSAELQDVVGVENTAGGSGGVVSVSGRGASLVVDRGEWAGNSAGLDGGALSVTASDAAVVLTNVRVVDNNAGRGGGGLAVVGADGSVVLVSNGTHCVGNSAGVGGTAFAASQAVGTELVVPLSGVVAVSSFPRAAGGGGETGGIIRWLTSFSGGGEEEPVVGDTSAAFGGAFAACNGVIDAAGVAYSGSVTASVAGGWAFTCALTGTAAPPPLSWVSGTPPVGTSAGGYGDVRATPPVEGQLEVEGGGAGSGGGAVTVQQSGADLGGVGVMFFDAYGSRVTDVTLSVGVAGTHVSLIGSGIVQVLRGEPTSLTGHALGLTGWPESLGVLATVTVGVGGARVSAEAPSASTVVSMGGCLSSQGITASDDGSSDGSEVLRCAVCPFGTVIPLSSSALGGSGDSDGGFGHTMECVACPDNTVGTGTGCTCAAGFFSRSGAFDVPCEDCPVGAVCGGGSADPLALPGFFEVMPAVFARCVRPGACAGGLRNASCAAGHVQGSYLCSECESEWFSDGSGRCVECPAVSAGLLVMLFVGCVVIGVVAAGVVVWTTVSRVTKEGNEGEDRYWRVTATPQSLSAAIVFGQILGVLGDASLSWPGLVSGMLSTGNVAALSTSSVGVGCSMSWAASYVVGVAIPGVVFGFTGLAVLVVVVLQKRGVFLREHGAIEFVHVLERAWFTLGPVLYIPAARATLVLFDCVRVPDGTWALDADASEECFDGTWWGLVPVAVFGIVGYVVAIPLSIAVTLWRNRRSLSERGTILRYGYLFEPFRLAFAVYGGVADLLRRLVFVSTMLFASDSQVVLLSVVLGVWLASAIVLARMRPFFLPVINQLRLTLDVAVVALVALASLFWSGRLSESQRIAAVVAAVGVVVVSVVVLCVVMVLEVRWLRDEDRAPVRTLALERVLRRSVADVEDRGLRVGIEEWLARRRGVEYDGGVELDDVLGGEGGGVGLLEMDEVVVNPAFEESSM